jgi:hypothetical protein
MGLGLGFVREPRHTRRDSRYERSSRSSSRILVIINEGPLGRYRVALPERRNLGVARCRPPSPGTSRDFLLRWFGSNGSVRMVRFHDCCDQAPSRGICERHSRKPSSMSCAASFIPRAHAPEAVLPCALSCPPGKGEVRRTVNRGLSRPGECAGRADCFPWDR